MSCKKVEYKKNTITKPNTRDIVTSPRNLEICKKKPTYAQSLFIGKLQTNLKEE